MIKKTQLLWTLTGFGLIIIGLVLGWQPIIQSLHTPSAIVQAQPLHPTVTAPIHTDQPLIAGTPMRIALPSLGLDLQVINGYYNAVNQTWTLTKDKAQFAANTAKANNQQGNTFIYGHNRAQVFENLYKIKPHQQAVIYTNNNHKFIYEFTDASVTNPNDTTLFQYQGPPILTLQTCSGLWFQNRQLFHFNLVSVT